METIEATHKGFVCQIGKPANNCINVMTNFVPLDHVILVNEIRAQPEIKVVSNVADYEDGTGGLSVKMHEGFTSLDLKNVIEICMINFL